jgi:para-nitrobenzyl esterase
VLFAAPLPQWGRLNEPELVNLTQPLAGARAQQAVDLYKTLHPGDSPSYLLVDIVTDFWMREAANRVAELKARQHAAPAFVYVLEWEINQVLRSPHGTDVSLVFDNMNVSAAISAGKGAQQVADQLSSAWIAFARTGKPEAPQIPHWPSYTLQQRANLVFNERSRVVNDYGELARKFWEQA